jgi:hypothetical protein
MPLAREYWIKTIKIETSTIHVDCQVVSKADGVPLIGYPTILNCGAFQVCASQIYAAQVNA